MPPKEAQPLIRTRDNAVKLKAARRGKTYSGMQFKQGDPRIPNDNDLEGGRGGLESNVWWHGEISGGAAERRLQMYGQADGLFLLRKRGGEHVLSVCYNHKACNYLVKNKRGGFSIGEDAPLFYSLPELVDYFRDDQGGLPCVLLYECPVPTNPETGKYTDIGGGDEASGQAGNFAELDRSGRAGAGAGKKKRTKRILTAAQKRERKALKQRLYEQQLQEQLTSLPAYTPYWCRGSAAVMGIVMIAQLLDGGIVEVTLAPKAEPKVLQQNMTAARQSYEVTPQSNVMIGPASSSLIHYGAKFGPCMREDIRFKVTFANAVAREQDMQLRCCSMAIGGTAARCGQISTAEVTSCSGTVYSIGAKCPPECNDKMYQKPCCYYDGRCEISSKDYCQNTGGVPSLSGDTCGTATCLADICGMGAIENEEADQWYRLFVPIFVHSGVLHYAGNMMLQLSLGVQIERVAGSLRTALIYVIAGVGGYLTSAVFSPSIPSVGASGAIFGLLGVAVVDLFQSWKLVKEPWKRLFWTLIETALYLAVGTLPFIDNWAHIGGFFFGVLAAIIFLPYLTFGLMDSLKKRCMMFIAIPVMTITFFIFFLIFYEIQDLNGFCPGCKYIQCYPYSPDFCKDIPGWENE